MPNALETAGAAFCNVSGDLIWNDKVRAKITGTEFQTGALFQTSGYLGAARREHVLNELLGGEGVDLMDGLNVNPGVCSTGNGKGKPVG